MSIHECYYMFDHGIEPCMIPDILRCHFLIYLLMRPHVFKRGPESFKDYPKIIIKNHYSSSRIAICKLKCIHDICMLNPILMLLPKQAFTTLRLMRFKFLDSICRWLQASEVNIEQKTTCCLVQRILQKTKM